MEIIKDKEFGGERPLFGTHDIRLENVTIREGESAIKECRNIEAVNCRFEGNYPFWHVHKFLIEKCYFAVGGRSALWYSDHLTMKDTVIDAPKMFREMSHLKLENVVINDADEVFWRCDNLRIRNLKLHDGTYPFMFSHDIEIDGLDSDSKYVFQYVRNAVIRKRAHHHKRRAMGNAQCHRVRLRAQRRVSRLAFAQSAPGQLPHNRRTAALLCPRPCARKLHLRPDCDRAFEYSTLEADIHGNIINIKNPISGHIVADEIGSVTIDENIKAPADCIITVRKK